MAIALLLPLITCVIDTATNNTTHAASDSNQVVFFSDCSSATAVTYRIDPAGTGSATFVGYGHDVRVSPDGKRVALITGGATIQTFDIDGGGHVHTFTDTEQFSAGWTGNPAWSPDSSRFAIGVARYDDVNHDNWAIRTFVDDTTNTSTVTPWSKFVVTDLDWRGGTWLASYGDATDPAHPKGGVGTTGAGDANDTFADITGTAGQAGVPQGVSPRFDSLGRPTWTQAKPGATGLYVNGSLAFAMDTAGELAYSPGGDLFAAIRYRPNFFNLDIITTGGTYVRTINQSFTECGLDWLGVRTPPRASFTAVEHAVGSATWDFDGTASNAVPPATIDKYEWDFGDPAHTKATGATPSFKYPQAGTYTVTLTVTDSAGLQHTTTKVIEVKLALIVNSTGDAENSADAGDGCNTGGTVNGKPECTLRAAIQAANTGARAQTISFAIESQGMPDIITTKSLPRVTASITVDGTTQPGGWVRVTGPDVTASTGLAAGAADVTFTGMVMAGFEYPMAALAANTTIVHNRIGVDAGGTTVTTAPSTGVFVLEAATATTIEDNVITAKDFGVVLGTSTSAPTATVSNNRIGTDAGVGNALSMVPDGGVWLVSGSATIENNTIAATTIGIMAKSAVGGSRITGNHVGINAANTAFTSAEVAIMVNGTPDVLVENNLAASTRAGYGDVTVAGVNQLDSLIHLPRNPLAGAATGTNITIRGNTLGMLPSGAGLGVRTIGVLVFAHASNVAIDGNSVGGHAGDAEIFVDTGTSIAVTNNRVGVNPAGTATSGTSASGIRFGGVTNSTITGNVVDGASDAGVDVTTDIDPAGGAESSDITISDNTVGLAVDRSTVLGNGTGVRVMGQKIAVGPGNVVSGNSVVGIAAQPTGEGIEIEGNAIGTDGSQSLARPNGVGIEIDGSLVWVTNNRIAGNTGAGLSIKTNVYGTVSDNKIGFGAGGQSLGNGTGVTYGAGSGYVINNDIRNSKGAGIETAMLARVTLALNSTWNNAGKGIDGTLTPQAPTLDAVAVTANGHDRLWFVLSDLSQVVGIVHLYGNESCAAPNDDEGRHFIETSISGSTASTIVFAPKDPKGLRYAGYTVTFTESEGGTADRPLGRTSNYSVCAAPHTYPDTSGTGIPDIIQNGLGGTPGDSRTATFPSDAGGQVKLGASGGGHLVNVGPSDAPTPPDGVKLLSGQFSFELTGLTPGASAAVAVETTSTAASYYRYGPPIAGLPAQWYSWAYNPASGVGAERDPSGVWVLHLIDGFPGDDDGVANGTIVDPGGPGDGPTITPPTGPVEPPPPKPCPDPANHGPKHPPRHSTHPPKPPPKHPPKHAPRKPVSPRRR